VRFVQSRVPGPPLFLLGHSLGGIIVLDYAIRYPDGLQGVVAISPALGEVGISPAKRALGRALSRVWPTFSLATGLDASALSREPDKELRVYPGGYHQVHNDLCADDVTADLLRWLDARK
jgi:acylglycerol lipase